MRSPSDRSHRSLRSLRLRALLAGGLVLGLGGTLTLASWTDEEYSGAEFTASTFALVSRALDDTTSPEFVPHDSVGGAAVMRFDQSPHTMSPGSQHMGRVEIALSADSTVGGTVDLTGIDNTNPEMAGYMEYRAVSVGPGVSCASATYPSTWTSATSDQAPFTPFAVTVGDPLATYTRVCTQVRLVTGAPSSLQGQSNTLTWIFTGTSD
ncbi:SipW-dependent-type signal peptide-containing protein [Brevibacterium litoralis]|uniref:SipW-dependent-type signal peptide-containing protein n=1 Tax=Brevibacterium litoralis TaxID=3138935 RepID=UPI0032EBB2DF